MEKYLIFLKLKPNVSLAEIKKAYKVQVKIWHPDRFPIESERLQKKAHDMFQKITITYKKLTESHYNKMCDSMLACYSVSGILIN